MNIDNMVLEFVKLSRVDYDKISVDKENQIKKIYDEYISSILKKFSAEIIPNLIICNTFNKYSTILPVRINQKDYKYYLLYDCYLSQINRRLDLIFFTTNSSEHDIWKLSYELFAEDALLNNDTLLFAYFGLNKIGLGPFDIKDVDNELKLNFVEEVQERYILAHEIGHWIYKTSVIPSKDCDFNIKFEKDQDAFYIEIKQLLCELYRKYEDKFRAKEYFQILKEHSNIIGGNSSGIHEECFADAIAYAMVFSYINTEYPDSNNMRILAGQALFIELLNLQLLAMQHMMTSKESFEASTSIRISFFIHYAVSYFEGIEILYNNMLGETVDRYEKRITNIILECFATLEDRADNIHNGVIDIDKALDQFQILGLSDYYANRDLT